MALIRVYDTLSGQKKELQAPDKGPLRIFVCGPTVYDHPQIGNLRTYVSFDNFVRHLRSRGVKVFYLQNITDIDDKIIDRAKEQKTDWKKIARKFEKIYHDNEKTLGIISVNKHARATSFIKEIVDQVRRLADKGHAYKIEGDGWYFDISTFPDYGKLSRRTAGQAEDSVSRIDESVHKKNKGDFALWKFVPPNGGSEPSWKTKIGEGRPGWHIEDTAITEYVFGPQYDIHGGGLDLKFPHHEAEIAQMESASGKKPLAKIWMHAGHLLVGGKKMSKSAGNFITLEDFLAKCPPKVFRFLAVQHHYRSPLDYSDEAARQAMSALDSIEQFFSKLEFARGQKSESDKLSTANARFASALEDDFNTPEALAEIFKFIAEANPKIWDFGKKWAKEIRRWLEEKLNIFGIELKNPKIPLNIRRLAKNRELFRTSKQFAKSDQLRNEIEALGYTIEDTPAGPFLWPKLINDKTQTAATKY